MPDITCEYRSSVIDTATTEALARHLRKLKEVWFADGYLMDGGILRHDVFHRLNLTG